MIRRIIQIDEAKCNGCGACAAACHEGAIGMVNGKAKLLRDDYCDGLGDCLPNCPTGAICFVEREAAAYDEAAVKAEQAKRAAHTGCPGSLAQTFAAGGCPMPKEVRESSLSQWPVQIKLAPVQAPYFKGAHLLIAADCSAFAYGDFHRRFMQGKITLIGCPKLDGVDYSEKLTAILEANDIQSLTVARMQVPCCGGIELAARKALKESGKPIPWHVVTLATDGRILSEV